MNRKEIKRKQDVEWTRMHTLSQEQLQKLLDGKFERAYNLHQALSKREMSLQRHRWSQSVKNSSNASWARHYKHLANGRPRGWSYSCVVKNPSVLKHSLSARRHVGSSMKSALIHTFKRVCLKFYSVRLSVRSLGFQPGKTGSIPVPSTILKHFAR